MFRILPIFVSLIFQALSGSAQASPKKIEVETRFNLASPSIPDSCTDLSARAQEEFKKSWQYGFDEPSEWVQVDLEKENSRLAQEKKDGVHRASYLAPVGSEIIFLSRQQATGSYASLFINCNKSEAIVSLRGGITDFVRWFGPFKIDL